MWIVFFLQCATSAPIQVGIEQGGHSFQNLMRRETTSARSELEAGTGLDECKESGFPGGELRKARKRWASKQLQRDATMKIPHDNATIVYAVRGGKLYRAGTLKVGGETGDAYAAGDNVFCEALLWRTLRRFPELPDADLVLSYGDTESPDSDLMRAPVFTFSPPRDHDDGDVGFPSPYLINEALDMKERTALKGSLVKQVPWEKKMPQAYWRGSLTGRSHIENASMASRESRAQLAKLATMHSEDIDFAFTGVDLKDSWGKHVTSRMRKIYKHSLHSESVNFYEVLPQYKYLLDVDGVSVAWRGLPLLASGSLVLLETGERGEFFFQDLKPWVHYVPVKKGLTDLMAILSYLKEREGTARRIGLNGRQFALTNLSLASLECYCLDALKFMSEVATPIPLPELQRRYDIHLVPEPDEHLRIHN